VVHCSWLVKQQRNKGIAATKLHEHATQ